VKAEAIGCAAATTCKKDLVSYISPEKRVPADHPLLLIRKMVDEILKAISPQFAKWHSNVGVSVDSHGTVVAVAGVADLLFCAQ
jgi:hypothetical protein